MSEELTFNLSRGMVEVLSRYHNGNQEISNIDRAKGWLIIQKLYDEYKKYSEKLNYLLNVEWEEKEIESHYCDNIFKNAHKRLNSYEDRLKKLHKTMFLTLTRFDKINSPFIQGEVISAKEIYLDFKNKYVDKTKQFILSQKSEVKEE